MEYSFDIDVAEKYGLPEAILLKNIIFWHNVNEANEKNFFDGRYWTYNSASAFAKIFPFWGKKTVERILQSLKDQGLVYTGQYNEMKYDRTLWYSPTELAISMHQICRNHTTKMSHGNPENVAPIPDSKPVVKPVIVRGAKNKYGSMQNVMLSDEELVKLFERFGQQDAEARIERLSLYVASKGDKYKSHYATILQWAAKDEETRQPSVPVSKETPSNRIPNLWEMELK